MEASLSAPSECVMIVMRFFATRNRSRQSVVVPESMKMVSPSSTSSAARRPMSDLSTVLRLERMGVGTAPEGTVAVTPPYTFVIWPRISSSFRSRRMVFLDTPKTSHNSSMLTVSREITYCSMEFNRLTFIFMLLLEKYPNKSTMYLYSLSNYAQVVYCTESQKSGLKFGEKAKRQAAQDEKLVKITKTQGFKGCKILFRKIKKVR